MAKKDKKKKDKQKGSDAADAIEAVRSAVERTFHATSEGAAGTQKRTRALVDEIAHAAARVRDALEDLKVVDEVRGLRAEVEGLARRIRALEIRDSAPSKPAPVKRVSKPAKRTTTAKRAKRAGTAKRAAAKPRPRAKAKPSAKSAPAKPAGS